MNFFLDKLTFVNFKGIRKAEIDFGHVTDLLGKNATGKTTVLDGFTWLLFGKDSAGRKDFDIKTVDADGDVIARLDHEVEGWFHVDGHALKLRRVYIEKWERPRGAPRAVFTGHTTEFYWNGAPVKDKEYAAKIAAIIPEDVFRLLTNTAYFNSLLWHEQRAALMAIVPPIKDEDIFTLAFSISSADFAPLRTELATGKTLDEIKRETASKKAGIEKAITQIPGRIDEARRALPEAEEYEVLEAQPLSLVRNLENELANIDRELQDQSVVEEKLMLAKKAKLAELTDLMTQANGIERRVRLALNDKRTDRLVTLSEKKADLRIMREGLRQAIVDRDTFDKRRIEAKERLVPLRNLWTAKNAEVLEWDPAAFVCPSCHQPLPEADREAKKAEIEKNFNEERAKALKELDLRGKSGAADVENNRVGMEVQEAKIEKLRLDIDALAEVVANLEVLDAKAATEENIDLLLAADTEYQGVQEMIRLRREEVESTAPLEIQVNRVEKLNRGAEIKGLIKGLTERLATKEARARITTRIMELEKNERDLAEDRMRLDGVEYAIAEFNRAKMQLVENTLNAMFGAVKFKLFDRKINGAVDETCVCLVKGVPYPSANTAGKVQAGLDIINVFSKFYNIYAPIWIDNRESVIDLPVTESQLICLKVSAGHDKLTWKISPPAQLSVL